ncbi:MAG: pentapeptide repeat-containing protein [Desulfobacteraceae bacterium]|nr:pentapeptide repeat-containing protein [Desulfobacteraceae bacterium]
MPFLIVEEALDVILAMGETLRETERTRVCIRHLRGRLARLDAKIKPIPFADLSNTEITMLNFKNATLRNTWLNHTYLLKTSFHMADLRGSDFNDSRVESVDFNDARLSTDNRKV